MAEPNDDEWLESTEFQCQHCDAELERCDHSPFEDGYYFYCTDCPIRVDVSIYDQEYDAIQRQLKSESISMESDDYLDHLFPRIEARLSQCKCGGSFKNDAPRRCLKCGVVFPDIPIHQNVWHKGWGTDDEPEGLHQDVVFDAKWQS